MPNQQAPQVVTESGTVEGEWDNEIACFKGIPFAAPPVGDLRWRPPQPVEKWQGVKAASKYGPASWQNRDYCVAVGGGDPGSFSEDCLYLNVWSDFSNESNSRESQDSALAADPVLMDKSLTNESLTKMSQEKKSEKKKAVMVWLHGGGFSIGSGGLSPYIGSPLASQGVVVVTLNYRLGHLGFFAHPALDAEYPEGEKVNNFGLLDQIAALQWVRKNIAAFGGDPDNVTLFGESSGARSVLTLFASPLAKGLFNKGIVQSGYTLPDTPRDKALDLGERVASHFGLANATAQQLRSLPEESFWNLNGKLGTSPVPIVGDAVLPEPMLEVFRHGKQHALPLMIGSNSDEPSVLGYFNIDVGKVVQRVRRQHPLGLRLIKLLYPKVKNDKELGRQISRDMVFTTMGYVAMVGQHKSGAPGWRYYFDYVAENARKQCPNGTWHGNEIPFVMNNMSLIESSQIIGGAFTPQDKAFAAVVSQYWLNFARHVDSTSRHIDGEIRWPSWRPREDKMLRFGNQGKAALKVEQRFMRLRLRLFRLLMTKLVKLD